MIQHDFSHLNMKQKIVLANSLKRNLQNPACAATQQPVTETLKQLQASMGICKPVNQTC